MGDVVEPLVFAAIRMLEGVGIDRLRKGESNVIVACNRVDFLLTLLLLFNLLTIISFFEKSLDSICLHLLA